MATLTSYDGSVDDTLNLGGNGNYDGQSFQIPSNSTCTGFSMKGSKGASYAGGTIKIGIYTGITKTGVVYEETTTGSFLSAYTLSPSFVDFTFASSFSLTASTTYYIYITFVSGCHSNDEIRWSADNTSPSYSSGTWCNNGTSYAGYDHNFKIYGTVSGGATQDAQAFGPGI